jgi:hypothetical protein
MKLTLQALRSVVLQVLVVRATKQEYLSMKAIILEQGTWCSFRT